MSGRGGSCSMNNLTSRWYVDERDLDRMLALVSASTRQDGARIGHFHRGDIVWGLFQNLTIDPTSRIRLFEDEASELRGFIWLHPPQGLGVHVDTTSPEVSSTIEEMIRWAEAHLQATTPGDEPITTFEVEEVSDTNDHLHKVLAELGYRSNDQVDFQLNRCDLGPAIEEPILPAGAEVRPVRFEDAAEVEARVALHQEIWESSRFTEKGYARLRSKPVYRPDLDLVAVTPNGELASYCIAWWDPATRSAEFEPVGTASRFRRQGYGKAMLLDAMQRLQSLGANEALVICSTSQKYEPSRFLYASAGFSAITRFETWERSVQG